MRTFEGTSPTVKRIYYFSAGVALGAVATRRTRRAKEAARAALAAKLTPSAIAADVADAIAELGNAVGSFAADIRQGAANRRATYRPMIDNMTGSIAMMAPDQVGPAHPLDAIVAGGPEVSAEPGRRSA
ncbi:hypothetical protein [Nakamurella sp. PAMC28650]|jgi:hypothetical protein|uniref:hypothetical protein n=1 Tax=Nakamurella sp. PAMC28650 TaxID=2762325 RepID=UPI00164E503C|nr:hypothetical protein [Nakamurella sp. PAMC28650]QNK79578.1 hypothetical protein H7F38_14965 [Nakamurella sp. PAMC28650]